MIFSMIQNRLTSSIVLSFRRLLILLIIVHLCLNGLKNVLNSGSILPFVEQIEFFHFAIALIHTRDVDFVDKAKLRCFFWVFRATGDFQ